MSEYYRLQIDDPNVFWELWAAAYSIDEIRKQVTDGVIVASKYSPITQASLETMSLIIEYFSDNSYIQELLIDGYVIDWYGRLYQNFDRLVIEWTKTLGVWTSSKDIIKMCVHNTLDTCCFCILTENLSNIKLVIERNNYL